MTLLDKAKLQAAMAENAQAAGDREASMELALGSVFTSGEII